MTDTSHAHATADAESSTAPARAFVDPIGDAIEEALQAERSRRYRKGDRVHGRVRHITDTMAFVDLGGPAEGMLDLTALRAPDGTLALQEGQELEAIVLDAAANGVLLKQALVPLAESVEQLRAARDAALPVEARITGAVKGGVEVELLGLRGFCPASHLELHRVGDLSPYLGRSETFIVTELSDDGRQLVVSRRPLLTAERERRKEAQEQARVAKEQRRTEARARIVEGAELEGTIARVQPFGAFVDLGAGIEGLCHVSELTRARAFDATTVVKPGQRLAFKVLRIEESTDKQGKSVERFVLSRKVLEADPWAEVASRFAPGAKVSGKVVRLTPFGAFVELAPGVDGLAHISTLSDKRVEHPSEVVKEGDVVEAWVLAVEADKQRVALSLREPRAARPAPRPAAAGDQRGGEQRGGDQRGGERRERRPRRPEGAPPAEGAEGAPSYKVGQVVEGPVERVEPFGVFVTLPGGVAALVPNNELGVERNADQRVDYRKVFPPGTVMRFQLTESTGRGLKGSVVEAKRTDEREMVREWSRNQGDGGSKKGFGTFADLFRKMDGSR